MVNCVLKKCHFNSTWERVPDGVCGYKSISSANKTLILGIGYFIYVICFLLTYQLASTSYATTGLPISASWAQQNPIDLSLDQPMVPFSQDANIQHIQQPYHVLVLKAFQQRHLRRQKMCSCKSMPF